MLAIDLGENLDALVALQCCAAVELSVAGLTELRQMMEMPSPTGQSVAKEQAGLTLQKAIKSWPFWNDRVNMLLNKAKPTLRERAINAAQLNNAKAALSKEGQEVGCETGDAKIVLLLEDVQTVSKALPAEDNIAVCRRGQGPAGRSHCKSIATAFEGTCSAGQSAESPHVCRHCFPTTPQHC